MITIKLKINGSKTEFIVFKSPQLRCDLKGLSGLMSHMGMKWISKLSGLSVNICKSHITQTLLV